MIYLSEGEIDGWDVAGEGDGPEENAATEKESFLARVPVYIFYNLLNSLSLLDLIKKNNKFEIKRSSFYKHLSNKYKQIIINS